MTRLLPMPDSLPRQTVRVYGVAIVIAPLLMLASTIAYIVDGEGMNIGVLGGVFGVWASFALLIAFIGILRLLESAAPRGAAILTVLAVTGLAAGVGFNVGAIVDAAIGADEVNAAFDVVIEAGGAGALLVFAFLPWGLFGPAAMVATGMLLWRTRTTSRWSGGLLALGGALFVASRPERIELLAIAADVVLLLALVPIGWAVVTGASHMPPLPGRVAEDSRCASRRAVR